MFKANDFNKIFLGTLAVDDELPSNLGGYNNIIVDCAEVQVVNGLNYRFQIARVAEAKGPSDTKLIYVNLKR